MDEDGSPTKRPGKISSAYILKHCPIEVGTLYSTRDAQKTLQNVFALDLFDNVQVRPRCCRLCYLLAETVCWACMPATSSGCGQARACLAATPMNSPPAVNCAGWQIYLTSLLQSASVCFAHADPASPEREGPLPGGCGGDGAREAHSDRRRGGRVERCTWCAPLVSSFWAPRLEPPTSWSPTTASKHVRNPPLCHQRDAASVPRCAGDSGRPGLVSLVPGGTITYENRNLFGNAASVGASVTTKNFLAPADDLSFRVQFNQVGPPGCPSGPHGRCSTLTYVLLLSRSSSHSPAPTSLYVARCLPPCMQSVFPTLAALLISFCSSLSSRAALHVRS